MEDKMKFVAIGLAAALLISIFANFQSCNSRKAAELARDALKEENSSLSKKVKESIKEKKEIEEKLGALKGELDKLTKEKDDLASLRDELQKQYEALLKERDAMQEKLKGQIGEAREGLADSASSREESYWARVIKEKTDLSVQVDSLRSELERLRIANEQLKRDKDSLELDLKNLDRDKEALEQQVKGMDSISIDLVREKNSKMKIQDDLTAIKRENSSLRRQLRYMGSRKTYLENKLQKLQEDKESLQRQFDEMGTLLESKMYQMGDVKEKLKAIRSGEELETSEPKKDSVELPPIVVRPGSETPASAGRVLPDTQGIGRILEVNRESKFVVIDLGEDYGLKIGDAFHVYRSGKLVGTIEVVQARKGITACDIKEEKTPIKIGDIIK
ncbi:MAG: hypothetical protein WC559_02420 [Candidatus Omnitrophota bacterium]